MTTVSSQVKANKWYGKGHDLVKPFTDAKLSVTDQESELLQRITRIVEWKGRYPVPLDFNKVGAQDQVSGYIAISKIKPADDCKLLCQLYECTKTVLLKTMEEVPPLPPDYSFS